MNPMVTVFLFILFSDEPVLPRAEVSRRCDFVCVGVCQAVVTMHTGVSLAALDEVNTNTS